MPQKSKTEIARDYVSKYFEIHAAQRLHTFQFFIGFATAIIGGLAVLFARSNNEEYCNLLLLVGGLTLTVVTCIFWSLEGRNKILIKHAERHLRRFEKSLPRKFRTVTNETRLTRKIRRLSASRSKFFPSFQTYSDSFRAAFILVLLIGLIATVSSQFIGRHSIGRGIAKDENCK